MSRRDLLLPPGHRIPADGFTVVLPDGLAASGKPDYDIVPDDLYAPLPSARDVLCVIAEAAGEARRAREALRERLAGDAEARRSYRAMMAARKSPGPGGAKARNRKACKNRKAVQAKMRSARDHAVLMAAIAKGPGAIIHLDRDGWPN